MLKTPVAFFIFNRPANTERVFEIIAQARPTQLLVIADGPRVDRPHEAERCAQTRAIIERVDWECEVLTNYSDINLGCKQRIASGLDWVFEQVESAIILEDDCLPHPSFFAYCSDLLKRYQADERISFISGLNYGYEPENHPNDYYFSYFASIWGWATWRRAWRRYDREMSTWPEFRNGEWLASILHSEKAIAYWREIFDKTYAGEIDTWDYQWVYSNWVHGALGIAPRVNLISNIGFGPDATHTFDTTSQEANRRVEALALPMAHPPFVLRHAVADRNIEKRMYRVPPLPERIRRKYRRIVTSILGNQGGPGSTMLTASGKPKSPLGAVSDKARSFLVSKT